MSMESTAWTQLHSVMTAEPERRPFARATLRRIAEFARPHRRPIARFVLLGVVTALLAVATPSSPGTSSTRSCRAATTAPSSASPCSSR